jgi:hypothetical protein
VVEPSSLIARIKPRAPSSAASVTMNGASRVYAISSPLLNPIAPQTASGARNAGSRPHCDAYAETTPPST